MLILGSMGIAEKKSLNVVVEMRCLRSVWSDSDGHSDKEMRRMCVERLAF